MGCKLAIKPNVFISRLQSFFMPEDILCKVDAMFFQVVVSEYQGIIN